MAKKVLLVGSGAREVAMARAIVANDAKHQLITLATHYNPDLIALSTHLAVVGDLNDKAHYETLLASHAIDLVIFGPEGPLAAGMVDYLNQRGVACIGPTAALSALESSKGYTRTLLQSHLPEVLPTFVVCEDLDRAVDFIAAHQGDVVIKADGLMSGKGVFVAGEHFAGTDQALAICQRLIAAQGCLVLEQRFSGLEFSMITATDGKTHRLMPLVQDYKRALVGNKGANTGGMGCVSCADGRLPFISEQQFQQALAVQARAIDLLQQDKGQRYCGFVYGGYMSTASGVKLIEFNVRLGDPEAMSILSVMRSDFVALCEAMYQQRLDTFECDFAPKATVCVCVVPMGYPDNPQSGSVSFTPHAGIYSGAIEQDAHGYRLLGSRALACVGQGTDIASACDQAQNIAVSITGDVYYREDIGRTLPWE